MKSLLVYRIGHLGDTLVAVPALWAVRRHFPDWHVTLLSEYRPGKRMVTLRDVLRGSGVCDEFFEYPVEPSPRGRLLLPCRVAALLLKLRLRRFKTLVYLPPSRRSPRQIARDRRFFAAAGIRHFIGMDGPTKPVHGATAPAATQSLQEADLLMRRLSASGIPVPPDGKGRMELGLGVAEELRVAAWLSQLPDDGGRSWISIGPGAKQPVKRWPIGRYEEVVSALIDRFDVWPVVFGGSDDSPIAESLVRKWGRGYNASGSLDIRSGMAAMKRCRMHLGNDTGTMHMAAAVGLRCVAIFSSHSPSGLWNPYGEGHRVLRTRIDCEGCLLEECHARASECILSITVEQVIQACVETLRLPADQVIRQGLHTT